MRSVIHEIRNHLTAAVAVLEALADGKLRPTPTRLKGTVYALQQVAALVGEFSAIQTPGNEMRSVPIDVCCLIRSELDAIEGLAVKRRVVLSALRCEHVAPDCARFLGDPVRIAQVVTNVLRNAILYSPAEGTVEVDCRHVDAQLQFRVSDQGPGVADAERAKIFEFGYRGTASRNLAGHGFGLAIVKELVERYGGTIGVENHAVQGAVFTVRLPSARAPLHADSGYVECAAADARREAVLR
jgi:two-component system sensor histidine kinase BaeS